MWAVCKAEAEQNQLSSQSTTNETRPEGYDDDDNDVVWILRMLNAGRLFFASISILGVPEAVT